MLTMFTRTKQTNFGKPIHFIEMKFTAKEGLLNGNILEVLTLACLQSHLPKMKFPLSPVFCDKPFNNKLEALERLYRSTGLIFLQWQKKFLTIIIQSLHFSSLKKKGMEKTCEKRRKKW